MWNISRTWEHAPIVSFGPLNNTIVDSNKPKIIRNSGELTDLEYLPSKQKMQNISRTQTHEPLISSGPLNYTRIHFKQALNDGEWWRTDKKIEYTLLLKHSMSDISKIWSWMPLISTSPKTYSIVSANQPLVGRKWYRTQWDTLLTHGVHLAPITCQWGLVWCLFIY